MPLPLLNKSTSEQPWAEQTLLCPLSGASGTMKPRPACLQLRYQRTRQKQGYKSQFDPQQTLSTGLLSVRYVWNICW